MSQKKLKEDCEKIKKLNHSFYYVPNTSTETQLDITITQIALDKLVEDSFLLKVFVPVYQHGSDYEFFEDLSNPKKENIDISECQDPKDYRPLTIYDLDFVIAYKRIT